MEPGIEQYLRWENVERARLAPEDRPPRPSAVESLWRKVALWKRAE